MNAAQAGRHVGVGAVALPYAPRAHQREAEDGCRSHRWSILVWHRRAGKTVFAVMRLILAALAFGRDDGRFGYIAPLLKQAKLTAWDYLVRFTRVIPGCVVNQSELWVKLPNGAVIGLYGADNPDAIRGTYFDGVVLDEVAQMKRVVWTEIVRPMLTDRKGWALFIGTPKGVNLFSETYFAACSDPAWFADKRTAHDTGCIPAEELEAARRDMPPTTYAQEFDCDFFAAVENILIPLDVVRAAQQRDLKREAWEWAPRVIGVDIARFGDDVTVIARRQGRVAFKLARHRGLDTMRVAAHVALIADEWGADAIFIDVTGGLGAGPFDRLHELGYPAIAVDFGAGSTRPNVRNRRSEMWFDMADWMPGACIPADDHELEQDLVAPTYDYELASQRKYLEAKDDIKERLGRSPDAGDALACTFWAPVAARDPLHRHRLDSKGREEAAYGRASHGGAGLVLHEYDPFNREGA